jgi:hypothetical protein
MLPLALHEGSGHDSVSKSPTTFSSGPRMFCVRSLGGDLINSMPTGSVSFSASSTRSIAGAVPGR